MNADASRWPRLKLAPHPQLDWHGMEYTEATLVEMADAIRAGQPGLWNTAIETLLRTLAHKPAALKALNKHRPTPGYDVVGLNRAVHFRVQAELHAERKQADVHQRVGKVWGVSAGQVKDDVAAFRVGDPSEHMERDAVRLTEQLVALARQKTDGARDDALLLIDADMRDRAAQHLIEK